MIRSTPILLFIVLLQGLLHDSSLADVQSKVALNVDHASERLYNAFSDDEVFERQIQKDQFGVERSTKPFSARPQLYLDIITATKPRGGKDPKTSVQLAEDLLRQQDFKGTYGPLIQPAWNTALTRTKAVGGYRPLAADAKKDPVKVADHVYSMDEEFLNNKKVYAVFNDVTSKHQASGASYQSYPFKGFYGLLLLNMSPYTQDVFRGVNYTMAAEKNKYIRFNRFLSSSAKQSVATSFAGPRGTVFIIKGKKTASFITPYSQIAGEDEYLISPDAQFLILGVDNSKQPVEITMQTVDYS